MIPRFGLIMMPEFVHSKDTTNSVLFYYCLDLVHVNVRMLYFKILFVVMSRSWRVEGWLEERVGGMNINIRVHKWRQVPTVPFTPFSFSWSIQNMQFWYPQMSILEMELMPGTGCLREEKTRPSGPLVHVWKKWLYLVFVNHQADAWISIRTGSIWSSHYYIPKKKSFVPNPRCSPADTVRSTAASYWRGYVIVTFYLRGLEHSNYPSQQRQTGVREDIQQLDHAWRNSLKTEIYFIHIYIVYISPPPVCAYCSELTGFH